MNEMEFANLNVMIGLEVHVQLTNLKTKLFCGCNSDYRGKKPNSVLCPTCLGLPGSLPSVNKKAIDYAVMTSLALGAKIAPRTLFFRKNYYYPDMPKNFQISQYDKAGGIPISTGGKILIEMKNKKKIHKKEITITRVQVEEDPGRLSYPGTIDTAPYTLVDYNRAGICLLEIITEPVLKSPKEARLFLQKLRSIMEHLGVDCSLEGAIRCDANISIMGGNRVEVKNISSFKDVERALSHEIWRQEQAVKFKHEIHQETRHWDEKRKMTILLRTKEEEHDYRYFPEPDLAPINIDQEFINEIKNLMPELPDQRKIRLVKEFSLPEYNAAIIVSSKKLADFFELCCSSYPNFKKVSDWVINELLRRLNEQNIDISEINITSADLVKLLNLIDEGTIHNKTGKYVLDKMIKTGKKPETIIKNEDLYRISNPEKINELIEQVFANYKKAVQDAIKKPKSRKFLIGKVMEISNHTADPKILNEIINKKLNELSKE
ncbi:MAG: Asp-tRNA(Asn)/Glu-tRNA(Gln) amidotransferase subunit GatB [Candidatus Helarchaeota archaeon]